MRCIRNQIHAIQRRLDRVHAAVPYLEQQKAKVLTWVVAVFLLLALAVTFRSGHMALAGKVPPIAPLLPAADAFGLALGLGLLLNGHFGRVRSLLFLWLVGVHVVFGVLLCRLGALQHFFAVTALEVGIMLLMSAVFARRAAFLVVACLELAMLAAMPYLIPDRFAGEFQQHYANLHFNTILVAVILSVLSWSLVALADKAMLRVQVELEARGQLNAALESKVEERTRDLVLARDAAEVANRAKSDFLANMSHEIRTPLHGMLGMVDLVLETSLPKESKEQLKVVVESGNHLLGIISDILEHSKIEEGRIEFQPERLSLHPFLKDVVEPLRLLASAKGIELVCWQLPGLPEWIEVDGLRLRQILVNLIGNGIKFTHRGEVRLVVEAKGDRLVLQVRDTGDGIAESGLAHIFERFRQADGSITRRYGGTGLGLSISRSLAMGMGGTLEVASEVGKGSVFTLELPLVRCDAPDRSNAATAAEDVAMAGLDGKRILLVDDNAVNRKVVEGMLSKLGCRIQVAEHGRMALSMLARHEVDLVLMDCQMPVMDGYEATAMIRSWSDSMDGRLREGSAIPVIGLTANASRQVRQECLGAGMDDVLTKPFRAAELREVIAIWCGRRHAAALRMADG